MVENKGFNKDQPNKILEFFIFGVTIIVVAVPEGLPLAVTISLAYRSALASAPLGTAGTPFQLFMFCSCLL